MSNNKTYMKNYYLLIHSIFLMMNDEISFNEEQLLNIDEKLLQFDTFHFSNDEISNNDEHP